MQKLFKTTIECWTTWDPTDRPFTVLASKAEAGHCNTLNTVFKVEPVMENIPEQVERYFSEED